MNSLKRQKGFATLLVTSVMLFLGTIAVMAASRVIFLEQKTANNTYKYAQAMAAARAGLDKGLSYLTNTGTSTPNKDSLFDADTATLKASAFPITETLGTGASGFSVTMAQPAAGAPAGPLTLLVTSKGCADGCTVCTTNCPVSVTLTQLIQFRKLVVNLPQDALLARNGVSFGGATSVSNTTGTGAAIRSGGLVTSKNTTGITVASDPVLVATPKDDYFQYFFGANKAAVKSQLTNLSGTFPPPGVGGAFWVTGTETDIHGGTYGSPTNPVVIIVDGNLQVNAGTIVYGMLYVVGGLTGWDNGGGGNANVIGAAVSEGDFSVTGTFSIEKDSEVLANLSKVATPARVLGSWKDF